MSGAASRAASAAATAEDAPPAGPSNVALGKRIARGDLSPKRPEKRPRLSKGEDEEEDDEYDDDDEEVEEVQRARSGPSGLRESFGSSLLGHGSDQAASSAMILDPSASLPLARGEGREEDHTLGRRAQRLGVLRSVVALGVPAAGEVSSGDIRFWGVFVGMAEALLAGESAEPEKK